ncbi:hypothetical protein GGR52DRAFT_161408 [Hypoxylon sp. FL1284]|nr:hypothetical protein GGR52DRAFT_161408 [Hypoxylon sp. FL1284]
MDLRPTLEALDIDSIADLTLEELDDNIQTARLSKYHTLQASMGWLNEHIKKDIPRNLSLFVSLLLERCSGLNIKAVFDEWQEKDAQENPTNRRRYLIVKEELFRTLEQVRDTSNEWVRSSSGSPYPHGKYTTSRAPRRDAAVTPTQALSNVTNRKPHSHGSGPETNPIEDPIGNTFTGLSLSDKGLKRRREDDLGPRKRATGLVLGSNATQKTSNVGASLQGAPPPGYVCKRCNRPGHWLAECPTNLDPAFDQAPGPDYVCTICRAVGKHFNTLCPRNKKQSSWNQKRLRALAREKPTVLNDTVSSPGRLSTPPQRTSPTAPSQYTERDAYLSDSGSISSQRSHERVRHMSKSLRTYRPDNISRGPPRRPKENSSSPLRSLGQRANTRATEGRLSYDNDVYMNLPRHTFGSFSSSPAAAVGEEDREDEVMEDLSPVASRVSRDTPGRIFEETANDLDGARAERDADEFLGSLTNDLCTGNPNSPEHKEQSKMESHCPPELAALLAACAKSGIIREKVKRMKAVDYMD